MIFNLGLLSLERFLLAKGISDEQQFYCLYIPLNSFFSSFLSS